MRKFAVAVLLTLAGIVGIGAGIATAEPLPDTKQVVGGGAHTCGLAIDGSVDCWGANSDGQLGDGTNTDSTTPVGVQAVGGGGELTRVKQLSAGPGSGYTCGLLTTGRVNCWGNNLRGQLGDGTTADSTTPVVVQAIGGGGELTRVKQLAAGNAHTCALLTNGRVNCWGNNSSGQLGDATNTSSSTPVAVQAIGGGGELTRVRQLAAGGNHTCALLTNGRVNCWGFNQLGQLGDGTNTGSSTPVAVQAVGGGGELTKVKQLATGDFHTCALLTNGRVNCWGNNSSGQLGDATNTGSTTPVVVQAVGGGGELTRVKQLAAGSNHTCALLTNGRVNCWGFNRDGFGSDSGQLGDGTSLDSSTPVSVHAIGGGGELTKVKQLAAGGFHTCAVLTSGRVNCWGNNAEGQLGDGTTTNSDTPVVVPSELKSVKQLASGSRHTCALLTDGRVNCWGNNLLGQLGDGTNTNSTTPVAVHAVGGGGELTRVKQLATTGDHTCALLTSGRVNCWGGNGAGQLGDGANTHRNTPVVVQSVGGGGELTSVRQLSTGAIHTCALLTNGRVNCWGDNVGGQLGNGTNTGSTTPVTVQALGGGGELIRVKQVAAGSNHSCALLTNGRVNCWGGNTFGQLGDGTTVDTTTPVAVHAVGGGGELAKIKQISTGHIHTCAVLTTGRVNCWGDNSGGQLGDATNTDSTTPVVVQAVGGGGELTIVRQVSTGNFHTCALLTTRRVNCWGSNVGGQLGDGTNTSSTTPVAVHAVGGVDELTTVKQLDTGDFHACALRTNGRVNCWGNNVQGQLGDGTTTDRTTPVGVVSTL